MAKRGNSEGSIYKRKDGRWAATVATSEGKRRTFYGKTRAEAHSKLQTAQRALTNGLPLVGELETCESFLQRWLRDTATRKVRPRTLERYEAITRQHLIPSLGRVRLARLTPGHVERMMNEGLARGLSPQTVAHHRAVLRGALNVGVRHGIVIRNAATLADPPRIPQREFQALTLDSAKKLLSAVQGDRLEALFTVALSLGLRKGEALGLRWSDVDLDHGQLSVRRTLQRMASQWVFLEPKTQSSRRTIAIPAQVTESLRTHRSRQLEERLQVGPSWNGQLWEDLVFADELGQPLSGFYVSRRFKKLLSDAGLPTMRYHDLRHGAASLMAALGIPPRVAMDILGHAQISTTMNIYAHVAPELQRDAADRVASALWATG